MESDDPQAYENSDQELEQIKEHLNSLALRSGVLRPLTTLGKELSESRDLFATVFRELLDTVLPLPMESVERLDPLRKAIIGAMANHLMAVDHSFFSCADALQDEVSDSILYDLANTDQHPLAGLLATLDSVLVNSQMHARDDLVMAVKIILKFQRKDYDADLYSTVEEMRSLIARIAPIKRAKSLAIAGKLIAVPYGITLDPGKDVNDRQVTGFDRTNNASYFYVPGPPEKFACMVFPPKTILTQEQMGQVREWFIELWKLRPEPIPPPYGGDGGSGDEGGLAFPDPPKARTAGTSC